MQESRILDSSIFDEIAAVIGSGDALKLCDRFGGTVVYVPNVAHENHPIVEAIGLDAARLLSGTFGSMKLPLPNISRRREMIARRRRVIELAAGGKMTAKEIALATGYTERHVHNITGESLGDPRQFKLFD